MASSKIGPTGRFDCASAEITVTSRTCWHMLIRLTRDNDASMLLTVAAEYEVELA